MRGRRANAGLREVDRLKMEVLRNVSHELATPMTPISGYVQMLRGQESGTLSREQTAIVERLATSVTRLKGLIDDLLIATRFATEEAALEPTAGDANTLIRSAIERHAYGIQQRDVNLEIDGEVTESVVVDRERMIDAISHLVSNGIKFGPSQGVLRLRTWLEVVGDRARNWALLRPTRGWNSLRNASGFASPFISRMEAPHAGMAVPALGWRLCNRRLSTRGAW